MLIMVIGKLYICLSSFEIKLIGSHQFEDIGGLGNLPNLIQPSDYVRAFSGGFVFKTPYNYRTHTASAIVI